MASREVLAGLVERVTFHNAENGFCVLRIKARGHRELITVIGHAAVIAAGEWVTASGEWVNDRTHGQQFKSRFMRTSAPTSIEGIEKYLGSGMIRGIGPVYAKKMVKAFGEKVFDVIEAEPDRLREVTGIGPMRAKRITGAWAEQKIVREIMVFLHSHGVGTARAVRIFNTYGADAVQVMTENPYRLARDIRGIGFKTADAIAMRLGIENTAVIRVCAGISYALTEAIDEGHCGLPAEELTPLAVELLEVPGQLIQTALDLELAERTVIADTVGATACIFLVGLYRAEQVIAERILRLANGKLPWPYIDSEKALPWIERKTGLSLAESQVAAIRLGSCPSGCRRRHLRDLPGRRRSAACATRPWFFRPRPAPGRSWDRKAVAFLRLSCKLALSATLRLGRTSPCRSRWRSRRARGLYAPTKPALLVRSLPGPNRLHRAVWSRVECASLFVLSIG